MSAQLGERAHASGGVPGRKRPPRRALPRTSRGRDHGRAGPRRETSAGWQESGAATVETLGRARLRADSRPLQPRRELTPSVRPPSPRPSGGRPAAGPVSEAPTPSGVGGLGSPGRELRDRGLSPPDCPERAAGSTNSSLIQARWGWGILLPEKGREGGPAPGAAPQRGKGSRFSPQNCSTCLR